MPLILCSGGVDSSTIVATANQARLSLELLHTAYINHDNNDLEKFSTLLEHYASISHVVSVDAEKYLSGLRYMWRRGFVQNTYAPTISYAMSTLNQQKYEYLVTGSGPDELFYGMEKYPFDYFKAREDMPIEEALAEIDTAYNLNAYRQIMNKTRVEVLEQVLARRKRLYEDIAEICPSIYDAQRMLAYCTVTSQHMHLFDCLARMNGLKHIAPFLEEDFIKLVFSIPIESLIDRSRKDSRVEIGKFHLKKYLQRFMPQSHVWSKKVGFHAPTTKFMYENCFRACLERIDYDSLPEFLDRDKARKLVMDRMNSDRSKIR